MIKIDHATFTYGENNEYSVGMCYVGRAVVEKQHSLE